MRVCVCVLVLLLRSASASYHTYNCSAQDQRVPDNSDLMVDCGTNMIILEVNLCTAQWAGFDPSGLALNSEHNKTQCQGTIDLTVTPPVIRYHLPVNHSMDNPCRQSLQIVDEVPDPAGPFSDFSSVQSVIITGYIDTPSAALGIISYATDLYYHFSCRYPLEYLVNNTRIVASSVSVATSDNNGTFIDTLTMSVFNDSDYTYPLVMSPYGLELRTKIYVEVKAVNLTGNFHVLLDHCFATPSPYNMTNSEQHNFFAGCSVDTRTYVTQNGVSMKARFNFEAFRFVNHRDQDRSTIYIHCILRLCEPSKCQELLEMCPSGGGKRRRRAVAPYGTETPDSATVSVGPLYTKGVENPQVAAYGGGTHAVAESQDVTGLVVGIVFGCAAIGLVVVGAWLVMKKFYWAGGMPHAFN